MFLLSLTYQCPLAAIDAALPAHKRFLDKHYASGKFLLSGRREPRSGGIILCQASSRHEVEATIAEDPFTQQQLAVYEIMEFLPTQWTAAFSNLCHPDGKA